MVAHDKAKTWSRRGFLSRVGGAGLAGVTGATLASCASDTGQSAAKGRSGSGEGGQYTCILDVTPYGKHAPWYVALEKGYWRSRGLDIRLVSAKGSGDAVTKLGTGGGEFCFADTSALIRGIANQGMRASVVCMYHYENLMSVQSLARAHIREPIDIVDKTMHVIPGEGTWLMLPALAETNGFDASKVDTVVGDITGIGPSITSGKVDGALTYATFFPTLQSAAREKGLQANIFLYSENGLDMYNNAINVMDDFAEDNPDVVSAFNAGFVEGVLYSVKNPSRATDIFLKHVPGLDHEVAQAQLEVAVRHLDTPWVRKHGFGSMSREKMQKTLDLVNQYFDLEKEITDADKVYTNSFVERGKVPEF